MPVNSLLTTLTDEELWASTRTNHEPAFTQLMQRYARRLILYGRKWSADEELVKDCVQDVFTELWLQRGKTGTIESVRAYLLASVRHRIGRLAKRTQRFGVRLNEATENEFTITFSVEDAWVADEESRIRIERLNQYVNRLPARQREVIYLKFHQNLTQSQIAQVMGIHYQSVSNLLQRTMTTLRDEFSSELFGWLGLLLAMR